MGHADPAAAPDLRISAQNTVLTSLHHRRWHQATWLTLGSTSYLLCPLGKLFSSQWLQGGWVDGGTCIPWDNVRRC